MTGMFESFGFERDIHNDFVDTTVREKQKAIGWTEDKVAQDHLTEAFHVFEEHRLALPIRADDKVVKGE